MRGRVVKLAACVFFAAALAFAIHAHGEPVLKGVTDKSPCSYRVGESIVFTFSVSGEIEGEGLELKWRRRGDDRVDEEGSMPLRRDGMQVKTSLSRPGFLHMEAWIADAKGNKVRRKSKGRRSCTGEDGISFTGGAGAGVDELRQGVPEPADFDARWKKALARLIADRPVDEASPAKFARNTDGVDGFVCMEVEVPSFGPGWSDSHATGYLTMPKGAKKGSLKARVDFDGYGIYPQTPPRACEPGWIVLHVNAHGLKPLSLRGEALGEFVRTRIENRGQYGFNEEDNRDFEKAYFFGMAMRAVSATSFMREFAKSRPEWDGKTLVAAGGSQGGLQAVWAAAFTQGVSGLSIHVPWCCDLGGTDAGRIGGWRPKRTDALGYFDPVNVAKRLPGKMEKKIWRSALGDYIAPPSTHAVLYNAMRGRKEIEFRQGADHYDDPEGYSQSDFMAAGAEKPGWRAIR